MPGLSSYSKFPLQNRQAIKHAKAKQSFYTRRHACTPSFHYKDKVPLQNRQAIESAKAKQSFYTPRHACTPSFHYKDKVPLQNRQAIKHAKAKQSFYTPITKQTGYQVFQGQAVILYFKTCYDVHPPFTTRIKSHYKADRLSSMPRLSSHFILQLQNRQARLSSVPRPSSHFILQDMIRCTPSFHYKDKVSLQNRQAIECAKAKQSFYIPITKQTGYQVFQGQAVILYSHYKTDRLSSMPRPSSHFILQDMLRCTPYFHYKDKVPLQNRQEIECAKAKQSFYIPITKQSGYQACQGQAVILYSKTCMYTLLSLQG